MNLYEILESYFPDTYLEESDIAFDPSNFLYNTKDFFQAYDPFEEKMITNTTDLVKSDIINQNMFGIKDITSSFSKQGGVTTGQLENNINEYFSNISNVLNSKNISELNSITKVKKDYKDEVIDRFQSLINLGVLDRPIGDYEVASDISDSSSDQSTTEEASDYLLHEDGTCPPGYTMQFVGNGFQCVPNIEETEGCSEYEIQWGLNGC